MSFWPRFVFLLCLLGPYAAMATYGLFWGGSGGVQDGLVTPAHIAPPAAARPFYAIMRAVAFEIPSPFGAAPLLEAKTVGIAMACLALLTPLRLAFIDWARAPFGRWALFALLAAAPLLVLTELGAARFDPWAQTAAQSATAVYFLVMAAAPLILRPRAPAAPTDVFE